MAAAGEGKLGAAGHTGYFFVTSSSDLQGVLRSLVSDNEGCTFAVPPPPNDYTRRDSISVSIGGFEVPRDPGHVEGWDFVDTTPRPSSSTERGATPQGGPDAAPSDHIPLSFVLMNLRLIGVFD